MSEIQRLRERRSNILRVMSSLLALMDGGEGIIRELAWKLHHEMNKELFKVSIELIKRGGM